MDNTFEKNKKNYPTVFISYSWDSVAHKEWVLNLAKRLIEKGIDIILDQFDLRVGKNMIHFMESSIPKADKVLIIFTPNYKLKAEHRQGGVGFEYSILNAELYNQITTNNKFIPVLKSGTFFESIPAFIQQFIGVDMTDSASFEERINELVYAIYDKQLIEKPKLGKSPFSPINIPTVNKNQEFVVRIKSILHKVKFNSSLSDVLTFEFGRNYEHSIEYDKLPIAIECANESIKYYWRYIGESKIGQEVNSFLNARGLNSLISQETYVVYYSKDNKFVRICLRIIPKSEKFDKLFTQTLIEGTSLERSKFNIVKASDYYYITGTSYTDHHYYEVLMCNEEGFKCCIHDWWHE
jgi:hypothetical protein